MRVYALALLVFICCAQGVTAQTPPRGRTACGPAGHTREVLRTLVRIGIEGLDSSTAAYWKLPLHVDSVTAVDDSGLCAVALRSVHDELAGDSAGWTKAGVYVYAVDDTVFAAVPAGNTNHYTYWTPTWKLLAAFEALD